METRSITSGTKKKGTLAIALMTLIATLFGALGIDSAGAATYATYRVTDDVSARTAPTAKPGGYGIPRGASFAVKCQVIGEPVGPRGNTLYFHAVYNGRTFYIPDTWTNSPHLAGQPPIAGIPMCGGSASPSPAKPTGTYASQGRTVRLCTNKQNAGCSPSGLPTVRRNSSVKMVCWQKGSWDTGDYETDMWFWITFPGGEGYVTASVVRNQTSVPACASKKAWVAAEAALARHGQRNASKADRSMFSNSEWLDRQGRGVVGEWAGDCPKLPYVAWRAAGVSIPKFDAITNYHQWVNQRGALQKTSPPRGALVFWNVTSWGHTAIALGNGFVATTTGLDYSNTPNDVKHYTSWSSYLGWTMPV